MAAKLVVFENNTERAMMCADVCHDWEHQQDIFGNETQKLLNTCEKLLDVSLKFSSKEEETLLLKKIFGIAKSHGVSITWYGMAPVSEPDRFLVSGRGHDRLAYIQC